MSAAVHGPRISPQDRLGLALFLAAALHAILILGLGFEFAPDLEEERLPTMEVLLVHSESKEAPEEADYLAQANQKGGGQVEEKVRPANPLPETPSPVQQGQAPQTQPEAAPKPQPRQEETPTLQAEVASEQKTPEQPEEPVEPTPEKEVDASRLLQRGREMARLNAEIRQRKQAYAQRPRHKYITANTREHVTASYEEAWRLKVERIGNLNYPEEARRRGLSGSLILDAAIGRDGRLHDLRVLRSSGEPVLDEAAKRIVSLAAPFAPLPESIRQETDVLHIVRTWRFRGGQALQTFGR